MEGPGKKPSTEFTRLHEKFEPGAFGYGKGEYLHAKGLEGQDALFPNALPSSPNGNEAVTVATKARRKGAKLVKRAMLADLSETVVEAALRRVHNKTGRLFDENNKLLGVTRGDLNLLRKELNREPTKFKQLYERHGPDLFGIGGGQHLHAERVGNGQVRLLYARAPLTENSSDEMTSARKESVKLVKRAMELEYGPVRAKAVFRNVREKVLRTGRDLKKDLTRGDLELLHKGLKKKQPATFIEIFSNFESVLDQRPDEPVRGEGTKVYIHDPEMSHGSGEEADVRRRAKYKTGAELVRQTIINQVGEAMAKATLAAVEEKNPGRKLGTVVTLNDLKLISQELLDQRARYEELKNDLLTNAAEEDKKGITKLYDAITMAVPGDRSPKGIFKLFERLKGMVHDDAKARFECVIERPDDEGRWGFVLKIGDTEIYRADRLQNGPGQHHIELEFERANASEATEWVRADLAEVWRSARDDKDKIVAIQWPNGDATSSVELRQQIKKDYISRNNVQFDAAAGRLTLEVEGNALDGRLAGVTEGAERDRITTEFQEGKMRALADFIRQRFGVGPEDHLAFQNIANNILSYVQQGLASTLTEKMLAPAVDKVFVNHKDLRLTSTFSVTADRNVGVDIDIRLPYRNIADRDPDEVIGSIDYSKYVVARRLRFEISGDHLSSETFDPKDDLRAVSQVDTVEITD